MALAARPAEITRVREQWVFHTHEVIECVTELTARASERELGMRNYVPPATPIPGAVTTRSTAKRTCWATD